MAARRHGGLAERDGAGKRSHTQRSFHGSVGHRLSPRHSFFFSSRRRHTRFKCDWSSDVCSSDLSEWSLTSLYLSDNAIQDLAPLAPLTRLHSLSLAKNQVKDIGPLAKVNRLSLLDQIGRASCRERV